jgi:hypothetical protein
MPWLARRYCTNRLHRLHRALGFLHTSGKGRFQPRSLGAEDVTDPRCVCAGVCPIPVGKPNARASHLLIPLTNAERAWSHAMELKAVFARGGEDSARKRHHAINRLAKASAWAGQLAALAASRADARAALEAEAYSSWMARAPPLPDSAARPL